jgi:RNA polymerase sigma factor (sigma-70 family)
VSDQTDHQLLRDFAERRSETAFSELVRRYVDLVHSAAFRMTGEAHSAQDVTQAVFVTLAQQAARLTQHPVLSGWLHTTARNLAAKHVRATVRRQNHEQEAAAMNELLSTAPDASWEEIAPHLDAALGELSAPERDAVLLRYFEKKSAAEIAARLGTSAEAAQKRVSRAMERLRDFFVKRGVSVGAGGLTVVISANSVQAAPVGLAVTISAAALTGTAVSTAAVLATTTQTIAMTTLQKTLVTVTVAVLAGAGIYEAHQAAQLRDQVQALQQQQAPLAQEIERLQAEANESTNRLANLSAELANTKQNNSELLKLRGEVGMLRKQTNLLANLKQPPPDSKPDATTSPSNEDSSRELVLRENYEFAGYATPPSAIKSLFWAATRADPQAVLASMAPALKAQTEAGWANKSEEELRTELQNDNNSVFGYRVTDTLVVSDNEVVLGIYLEGRNRTNKMRMVRVGDEWKVAGKPGR